MFHIPSWAVFAAAAVSATIASTSSLRAQAPAAPASPKPNVIVILADDLGYGDVSCLNKDSRIQTPNIDRLAKQGMIFTDAHSGSAVCTPTRYGLLTGRYAWRTHLRGGVLWGYSPPLIDANRPTIASVLQKQGYHTAIIGKWHLGWDWTFQDPQPAGGRTKTEANVDYSKPIRNGPRDIGFNYFYGISASLDMPPYCYVENERTVGIPDARKELFAGRPGTAAKDFEAADVLPAFTKKSVAYIHEQAQQNKPFFLYMPLNSPHTPITPSKEFEGKSGVSPYADFVMETDWAVGQILDALAKSGTTDRTLVVFTSDNGCSPEANFAELAKHGHNPNHIFRGAKADIWEGGHRVPFIARYPGVIQPGSTTDQVICLTDIFATSAALSGATLPANAAEDSVNLLPVLQGKATQAVREATVHQSIDGTLAIRQGKWKLELCPGSGGWSAPKNAVAIQQGLPETQLYDMSVDISERANVVEKHPEVVEALTALLKKYIDEGRSTPGAPQKNDVDVPLRVMPKKRDGGT